MGLLYKVTEIDSLECNLTLDRPVERAGVGAVWILEERRRTNYANNDLQRLLYNLGAHNMALQLLRLPFTRDR